MITIIQTPPELVPVYNPIYTKVSSDETTQEGFSFLFDLYVNGTFVNRTNLLPRPGTTQTIYSPARILESYISYDLSQSTIGATPSVNCIDEYTIVYGEEYVVYWTYTQIEEDSYNSTSFTVISGPTKHSFQSGDSVLIYQEPILTYPQISGVHNVESVIDDYKFTINVTYPHSSPTLGEPGTVTWSDKRKTEFIDDVIVLSNGTDYSLLADWSYFGPDGCGVQAGIYADDTITLVVPDVSCGSALQVVEYTSITPSFIPGRTYQIDYTITANDPSGEGWNVYSDLGGNSVVHNFDGVKSDVIVCGSGTPALKFGFNLTNADTGGFGSHALKVSDLTITLLGQDFTGYDFNSVIQYEEIPTFDWTQYQMDGITKKFLTKSPRTLKTMLHERGSVGYLNFMPNDGYQYAVVITLDNGTFITDYKYNLNYTGYTTDTNEHIIEFGCYPWNINQLSTLNGDGNIFDEYTVNYSIYIGRIIPPLAIPIPRTETLYFEMYGNCSKYEPVRFMFLNSLGQFDYYTATLLSRTTLNTSRDTYTKTLPYNYQVGDRGRTVINLNSQESYLVNTDWITEETAYWLTYELFNSNEIYTMDVNGVLTPIILTNTSMEPKKRVNDSLINYSFTYEKAVQINTIRG